MGDRAILLVKDAHDYAPAGVYLHWDGYKADVHLISAISGLRKQDPEYSLARLVGFLHNAMPGNTGLGITRGPKPEDILNDFLTYTPYDAGVLVYDCEVGTLQAFGGYLKEKYPTPTSVGVPPT